jgi:hypothetical protein
MVGGPRPDATPWDQSAQGGDCCSRVCEPLEFLAAPGELIHHDDTAVRMVTRSTENQQRRAHAAAQGFSRAQERTGMCTTAVVIRGGAQMRCLSDCGRSQAGDNRAAL